MYTNELYIMWKNEAVRRHVNIKFTDYDVSATQVLGFLVEYREHIFKVTQHIEKGNIISTLIVDTLDPTKNGNPKIKSVRTATLEMLTAELDRLLK